MQKIPGAKNRQQSNRLRIANIRLTKRQRRRSSKWRNLWAEREKEKKEKGGYGERLREITAVLKKHAITRGVSPEKLRLILEDLGPTYIKLGQIMSLRSDILPKRYCDELMKLCSEVPPMPFSQVIEVLEESMGLSVAGRISVY